MSKVIKKKQQIDVLAEFLLEDMESENKKEIIELKTQLAKNRKRLDTQKLLINAMARRILALEEKEKK